MSPEQAFRSALESALAQALGIEPGPIPLTYPPNATLGDLASPVCFELARQLRKPPRALAEAVVAAFEPGGGIARVEVAGAGYINAFLERTRFLKLWLADKAPRESVTDDSKIVVEHTNINPNKAAHIGHLRNAVLGDTLVRCLRHLGHRVEVRTRVADGRLPLAAVEQARVGFAAGLHGLDEASASAAYSQCDAGPLEVELIQVLEGETTHSEHLRAHGEGLHHVRFRVEDLDARLADMESAGFTTIFRKRFGPTVAFAYLEAPPEAGKSVIELLELPA